MLRERGVQEGLGGEAESKCRAQWERGLWDMVYVIKLRI